MRGSPKWGGGPDLPVRAFSPAFMELVLSGGGIDLFPGFPELVTVRVRIKTLLRFLEILKKITKFPVLLVKLG